MTIKKTHKNRFASVQGRTRAGFWPVLIALAVTCFQVQAQSSVKPVSELARLSLLEGGSETLASDRPVLWGGLEFRLAAHVKT